VLRRGQFTARQLDAEARWRAEVLATVRGHDRRLVLAHATAARARGLPTPLAPPPPLTFVAERPPTRRKSYTQILLAELADDEVVARGQVLVTSPARTVVDCARSLPPRDALAIADAAARRELVTPADLVAAAERLQGWPGTGSSSPGPTVGGSPASRVRPTAG
jgi:hypothetical protein